MSAGSAVDPAARSRSGALGGAGRGAAPAPRARAGRLLARLRPGVLSLLAMLFLVAGLARLGTGTAAALDAALDGRAQTVAETTAAAVDADASDPMDLFATLQNREARVAEAEDALQAREAALARAEADLRRQLAALSEMEAQLARTLAIADEAAERDLERLTAVFENMKPRDAAGLFEEMDTDFAAGFIGRLRPEIAAEILAGLSPRNAYAVSAVLAGRNANAPRD